MAWILYACSFFNLFHIQIHLITRLRIEQHHKYFNVISFVGTMFDLNLCNKFHAIGSTTLSWDKFDDFTPPEKNDERILLYVGDIELEYGHKIIFC